MHRSSLTTPDGVPLAVYEAGDPAGPEILFIHGFSQSALSWQRQMTSATLARFRLIAWDLRGHARRNHPFTDRADRPRDRGGNSRGEVGLDARAVCGPGARRYLRGRRTSGRSRATVPCAYRTIRWLARFQFRRIASTEPAGSRASSYKAAA